MTSKKFRTRVEVKIPMRQRLRFLCRGGLFVTIGGKIVDSRGKDISNLDLQLDGLVAIADFNRKECKHDDST